MKKRFYKLRDMMNQFFEFFLYRLVENLVLGKNQQKKVAKVSRFFGFSGKKFFFRFFQKP